MLVKKKPIQKDLCMHIYTLFYTLYIVCDCASFLYRLQDYKEVERVAEAPEPDRLPVLDDEEEIKVPVRRSQLDLCC